MLFIIYFCSEIDYFHIETNIFSFILLVQLHVLLFNNMAFCAEERSCGLITFRRASVNNPVEYLLLQTSYGIHHWTPPKGHVEPGEDDKETAYRETKEETGLEPCCLHLIKDFQVELEYPVGGAMKKVIYFLAELTDQECQVKLSEEHHCFEWAALSKACELVRYHETQAALKSAEKFIQQNC